MPKRITRTPLYSALKKHQVTLALTAGLIIAIPANADPETKAEWNCSPGKDNIGWDCVERVAEGKQYLRPYRPIDNSTQSSYASSPQAVTKVSNPNRLTPARNLDWVESEAMTPTEQENQQPGCCGAYIPPKREDDTAQLAPVDSHIDLTADATETIGDTTTLNGNVQLTQGYRRLHGDTAILNQESRTVELQGDIQLREPNLLLIGDTAHIEVDTETIEINNATYVFQDTNIRGTAATLSRTEDNKFIGTDITYTSCPPGSDVWKMVADNIVIDNENNMATTKNVRLHVKGVPILYLPYLKFPIGERKSGLLFPNIEFSGTNGFDYAQPYYLNLAPNYDATITARYLEQRGTMAATEFRHLSNWGYTVLSGAYLGNDDGGDPNYEDYPSTESFEGQDRWLGSIQHKGGNANFTTHIDYTKISDDDYFQDLGDSTLEVNSQTHLRQLGEIGYSMQHWDFNLKVEQFQTIYSESSRREQKPYKQLPRFDADGLYQFDNGLSLSLNNSVVAFDHDNDRRGIFNGFNETDNNEYVTGQRARFDWGLEWNQQWAGGYFTPGVKAKYITYSLDDPLKTNTDDAPDVTVPVAYFDSGLFFERDTSWLSGLIQTFEPRLYGLYSKYEDQSTQPDFDTANVTFSYNSLFRDDRFSGGDRIGDSQQVSLGLTTRLLDQNTGREIFRASIGQAYYFDDRKVSLNPQLTPDVIENPELLNNANQQTRNELEALRSDKSPIAADLSWSVAKDIKLVSSLIWDTDRTELNKGNFAVRYNNNENTLINLGYTYTRKNAIYKQVDNLTDPLDQDIEQANFSTVFPLTNSLNAIAHWDYDLTNNRNLESFYGIEYDSCCWRVSVVGRRWIDRNDFIVSPDENLEEDTGVFFQIQFKGLANSSSRVDNILSDGIYGYKPASD